MVKRKVAAGTHLGKADTFIKDLSNVLQKVADDYQRVFDNFSDEQRRWITALFDIQVYLDNKQHTVSLKTSEAAKHIYIGISKGTLPKDFDLSTLQQFGVVHQLPFRPDWRDRLEFFPGASPGAADGDKGYRNLTPGAVKLRAMLYDARQKEINRCDKKYGAGKGRYHAEPWNKWISKFIKKKAVQKLLHEKFNLKSGKGYIRVAASEFDVKIWRNLYNQEREERQ